MFGLKPKASFSCAITLHPLFYSQSQPISPNTCACSCVGSFCQQLNHRCCLLACQVPSTERSRAVTTVWGGLDVGSAVGLLLSGPLIRMYGWPSVFYLFAVLGGIWCLLWPLVRPTMQVSCLNEDIHLGGTVSAWQEHILSCCLSDA